MVQNKQCQLSEIRQVENVSPGHDDNATSSDIPTPSPSNLIDQNEPTHSVDEEQSDLMNSTTAPQNNTHGPVSSVKSLSKSCNNAPPPVSTRPDSAISDASSGGDCSSALFTA